MNDEKSLMTSSQCFDVLSIFLESYWERGERSSDDLAVLLGSLQRREDGLPLDPALWYDWLEAWNKVLGR